MFVARGKKSQAGAVLIRAVKPHIGIDCMIKNRNKQHNLTDGPAKLTQAMRIDKKQYGVDLTIKSELFIAEGLNRKNKIKSSPRIGISKAVDKKWNFKLEI